LRPPYSFPEAVDRLCRPRQEALRNLVPQGAQGRIAMKGLMGGATVAMPGAQVCAWREGLMVCAASSPGFRAMRPRVAADGLLREILRGRTLREPSKGSTPSHGRSLGRAYRLGTCSDRYTTSMR